MKLLTAVLVVSALLAAQDGQPDPILARGQSCCARFTAGETEALWGEMDEGLRSLLGSEDNLKAFRAQVQAQLGDELALVEETVEQKGDARVYVRTSRYAKVPAVIRTVFSFDAQDRIAGFVIQPVPAEAPSEHLQRLTKTELHLPFGGEWTVFWGGRTLAENDHAATVDQRFAYDILMLRDGSSHVGDGQRNEDYHCFGQPLRAPGAGVVVVAVDGIADNVPGHMNRAQPPGNHIIIDHGNGEFSLLAHFRQGSLKVAPGDRVAVGDALGQCGNSGNSSEPHLHYHLQDAPAFGQGVGLPAQFQGYTADGQPVARGEPVKGQRIARAAD